ncbi:MAG: RDD family protein [Candidatus Rokubacteria bacterium]|nr:RDD family protein [Candidatus Rokubacteria bacterium]
MVEGRPAGFWIRVLALTIDLGLVVVAQVSFGLIAGTLWGPELLDSWVFQLSVVAFTMGFGGLYATVLHALGGQTIGKMAAGIRVVTARGEPPTLGAALLRFFAFFLSLATLMMGYAMAGLRADKRALHDLIAGTRVERVTREPAPPLAAPAAPGDELGPPGVA